MRCQPDSGSTFRSPSALGHAPVDALQQHRQLRRAQADFAAIGLGPKEAAPLKTLAQQAKGLAVPPQQLDDVAASATKDKHMATEWVLQQDFLRHSGQAVEALAHIGVAGCQPDAGASWQSDHGSERSTCRMLRRSCAAKPGDRRRVAPWMLSSMGCAALGCAGGASGAIVTGNSTGARATGVGPGGNHLRITLALMP